ncbi:MAG TPA: hypothetical protein VGV87_08295 [Blastocatellia bacterium]|nr:hypothetical protein [Blastocatellia bacterium]
MGNQEQEKKGASAIESSDLTRRLFQRSNGKAGVVDVRHPQLLFERIARWAQDPFPLIGQLSARYAAEEQPPASTRELVMGRPLMEQLDGLTTADPQFAQRPPLRQEKLAGLNSEGESNASTSAPQGKLRIRRRPPQVDLNPDQPAAAPETPSGVPAPLAGDPQAKHHPAAPVASTAPPSFVLARKAVDSTREPNTILSVPPAKDSGDRGVAGSPSPSPFGNPQEKTPTITSIGSTSLILAKRSPKAARERTDTISSQRADLSDRDTGTSASHVVKAPEAAARIDSLPAVMVEERAVETTLETTAGKKATELILRKASSDKSGESYSEHGALAVTGAADGTSTTSDPATQPGKILQSAIAAPLPLAGAHVASMIQRKVQTDEQNAKVKEAPGEAIPGAVVAKEIADHSARPSRPNIIWRKSEPAARDSRLDVIAGSAPMVVARQTDNSAAHVARSASDPTAAPPPASDDQHSGGNNLKMTTEQVIRALYRRLAVERERRGIE